MDLRRDPHKAYFAVTTLTSTNLNPYVCMYRLSPFSFTYPKATFGY